MQAKIRAGGALLAALSAACTTAGPPAPAGRAESATTTFEEGVVAEARFEGAEVVSVLRQDGRTLRELRWDPAQPSGRLVDPESGASDEVAVPELGADGLTDEAALLQRANVASHVAWRSQGGPEVVPYGCYDRYYECDVEEPVCTSWCDDMGCDQVCRIEVKCRLVCEQRS